MKVKDDYIIKKFIEEVNDPNLNHVINEFYYNFFEEIKNNLLNGKKVKFRQFGSFEVVKYKSRKGYNFKTKKKMTVEGKNKIKFVPAITLEKKLLSSNED